MRMLVPLKFIVLITHKKMFCSAGTVQRNIQKRSELWGGLKSVYRIILVKIICPVDILHSCFCYHCS